MMAVISGQIVSSVVYGYLVVLSRTIGSVCFRYRGVGAVPRTGGVPRRGESCKLPGHSPAGLWDADGGFGFWDVVISSRFRLFKAILPMVGMDSPADRSVGP